MNRQAVKKNLLLSLGLILFIVLIFFAVFVAASITDVSLTTPTDNDWTNDSTPNFVFNATSNSSSNFNCTLWINNNQYDNNDSVANATSTTLTANTPLSNSEGYSWKIQCWDAENETNSSVRTLNIDATNPVASITQPGNDTNTTDNTPAINITLTDNLGDPINYTFYLNGSSNKTGNVANNTPTNVPMNTLSTGLWLIIVEATDNASNKDNSSTLYLTVFAPITANLTLSETTTRVGSSITVDCEATGGIGGVKNVSATSSDGTEIEICDASDSDCSASYSPTATGTKTITCTAYDNSDNSDNETGNLEVLSSLDGGGGGGGTVGPSFTLSEGKVYSKSLRVNEKARFKIDGVEHNATLKAIYNDSVEVEISSTPITTNLTMNEEKKFDLDDNNIYETSITLTMISGSRATLRFEGISESVFEEEEENVTRVSRRPTLVPGKGLINNTKLLAALEKVLARGKLSQRARENLERLSASITQDIELTQDLEVRANKSKLIIKIKNKGNKTAKNFTVYDKIPKTFANTTDDITVTAAGATIEIVEEDPEYLFLYPEIKAGQEVSIIYEVNEEVNTLVIDDILTELYAESLEEEKVTLPRAWFKQWWFWLLVAVIIISITMFFLKKKKTF